MSITAELGFGVNRESSLSNGKVTNRTGPVPDATTANKKIDTEDAKKIKKQIQNIERSIEKLEGEIQLLEIKLADPNFYNDPKFMETNKKYKSLNDDLAAKMLEWETLSFELEGI